MLTAEQIAELETKHARIGHLKGRCPPATAAVPKPEPAWEVVFRKPTRAEYKALRTRSHNPAQVADAQEILARSCVIYPTREAFDALLEDYPAIPEAATKLFEQLVGLAVEDDGK